MTPGRPLDASRPSRLDPQALSGPSVLVTVVVTSVIVAGLYFAREIFVPLALAMLLSFALAPPVRWLRHLRIPRLPAVIAVVTLAFLFIFAFGWVVAWQIGDLAQSLPAYQRNIEAKIDTLREAPPGGRFIQRAADMVRDLGRKMEEENDQPAAAAPPPPEAGVIEPPADAKPVPVVVQEPPLAPTEIVRTIVGPLLQPLATAGIVIVFVIFMLLKREDLRDRVIRLVGSRDLPRTTQAMNDAAHRVGQYLLMQLVVNTTYGIPIGVGLWLIGLPNPILWGMLATVLRFVPYIGPIIAASFPLALAVAIDPGWSTLLWAGALFIVVELISNNAVEPWLYGSSTGLSPVAVIAAAIVWTWLWGPVGLLLSTPLTVCLVVLGRHVPQLAFFDILFGDEPVLTPHQSLYERLLVGDPDEATERAEEYLREHSLEDFYDDVAVAALTLAESDRERGALDEERRAKVAESAMLLIDNLAEHEEKREEPDEEDAARAGSQEQAIVDGRLVLCAGARGNLDEAVAAMLAQLLERHGIRVRMLPHQSLQSAGLRELDLDDVAVVALSYMNAGSLAHARFLVRRLRRHMPHAAIIIGFWTLEPNESARDNPVAATGADRVATSLSKALRDILEMASEGKREPPARPPILPAAARS